MFRKIVRLGKQKIILLEQGRKIWDNWSFAASFLKKNPQPSLTPEQKAAIDSFWADYGIKLPDYSWHQMYYGVTGIHSPAFIPDTILGFIICPLLNRKEYIAGWDDKNFYQEFFPNTPFPHAICHVFNGSLYDENWNYVSRDEKSLSDFASLLFERYGDNPVFIKKSRDSFAGKGIQKRSINNSKDYYDLLMNLGFKDCIIQSSIEQHPFFSQFCKSSVNILRVVTWNRGDCVVVLSKTIRYGLEGSITDVCYKDGKEYLFCAGVGDDGKLNGVFCTLDGYGERPRTVIDTSIPSWEQVLHIVKETHKKMLPFNLIGWDITVNQQGVPVCIEYNLNWPGSIIYQFANGPFAGEYSKDFMCKVKEMLDNNIIKVPKMFSL